VKSSSVHDERTIPGDFVRRGWLDRATRLSGVAVGFASFLIAILVTYEVAARALFGITTGWVNDASVYMMGFITFVGAAYGLADGAHVGVDIVLHRASARTRVLLERLADLLMFAILATLGWLSAVFWWDAYSSGEKSWGLFEVSLWIPYSFLAGGMAWLLAVHVALVARRWRGLPDLRSQDKG
jgi:TRAP-type C4-dicarboxylate transport system permease small subunit